MFAVFATVCFLHGPVAPQCFPAQLSKPFDNEAACGAAASVAIADWLHEAIEVGWSPLEIKGAHCAIWQPPPDDDF